MKKEKDSDKQSKLVVTNYDNFKNAAFFIKQYHQAKAMLKEVDDFFESFVMSKLIESNGLSKRKDFKFKNIDIGPWLEHMRYDDNYYHPTTWKGKISDAIYHGYDYVRDENGKPVEDKKGNWIKVQKPGTAKLIQEACQELVLDKLLDKEKKYNTYYVVDEKGVLHDFIPVAAKKSIKTDFTKKDIRISGIYYRYYEYGARFGYAGSEMDEVKVTIHIDPSNNNVKSVTRDERTIKEGNADGKSYWDHHDHYCITSLTSKDAIKTPPIACNASL